jgi:hypothetical protein
MLKKLFKRNRTPAEPREKAEKDRREQEAAKARYRAEAESAKHHNYAGL